MKVKAVFMTELWRCYREKVCFSGLPAELSSNGDEDQ